MTVSAVSSDDRGVRGDIPGLGNPPAVFVGGVVIEAIDGFPWQQRGTLARQDSKATVRAGTGSREYSCALSYRHRNILEIIAVLNDMLDMLGGYRHFVFCVAELQLLFRHSGSFLGGQSINLLRLSATHPGTGDSVSSGGIRLWCSRGQRASAWPTCSWWTERCTTHLAPPSPTAAPYALERQERWGQHQSET